jgi:hypothetical protein
MVRFFLAGIIQGSIQGAAIHPQEYRKRLKAVLLEHVPGADVYCPIEHHPQSLGYSEAKGREVFFGHVDQAAGSDCLIAFVPEASMGTAVEMWEANRRGTPVLTISPLLENWVVKFLSTRTFEDIESFEAFVRSGELAAMLAAKKKRGSR